MKIVAFVRVKLNNERLSGKNLKPFDNGKPLLHYVLDTLSKVRGIDEIYVYYSYENIKSFLSEPVIFLQRDLNLDSSSTMGNDISKSFYQKVKADIYSK